MKKKEIFFKVEDEFGNETSKAIVKMLNNCAFRKLIKKVIMKKVGRGIHFQMIFPAGKKPIFVRDDMIMDDPEKLLYELRLICNQKTI